MIQPFNAPGELAEWIFNNADKIVGPFAFRGGNPLKWGVFFIAKGDPHVIDHSVYLETIRETIREYYNYYE